MTKEAIQDRIDMLEDFYADLVDACEYSIASEIQAQITELYKTLQNTY